MLKPDYYIDIQWMHKVSYKLERFKQESSRKNFSCRCPYCGDSKKSSKKTRFYFYTKSNSLNFDCKNCGAHGSFWTFMKDQCSEVFEEYKKDQMLKRLEARRSSTQDVQKSNTNILGIDKNSTHIKFSSKLEGSVPILDLNNNHIAVKYLLSRGFERNQINKLYYSENFKITAKSISPEPLSDYFPEDPRIVIPFYNTDNKVEMIQGRSLNSKSKLRYITIKADENVDKIYGKNFVDKSKTTYCVEGPLDSLFIDNCYATCDSNLTRSDADVLIWDNEPMNENIVGNIEQAITSGRSVVIWPTSPVKKQDINDMINLGFTSDELMFIIKNRTFSGLKAKLEFTKWKRC